MIVFIHADMTGLYSETRNIVLLSVFLTVLNGVFVADAVKSESVTEGESVTLSSSLTQIQTHEDIEWNFGDFLIAKVNEFFYDSADGRFRDRLKMNSQTGSLTINNIRTTDSGLYTVFNSRGDALNKINLTVYGVFVADAVKSESVTEGESVTLNSRLTQIQTHEDIEWRFGNILIAKVKNNKSVFYYDSTDGRFRDRLKMNSQTGSLSINNIRTTDSGLYTVFNSRGDTLNKISLTVYARLPVPVISRDCSSPSSLWSLVCSAVNVSHVTLSWFKGNSSFSSISVSDLSINLSLPLEVEYQDKNTYSCVINNPISHQIQHLNIIQLCHTCAEHCCGFTETVIRLALSALVGVALVAVLVYDIRSRSLQQKKSVQK